MARAIAQRRDDEQMPDPNVLRVRSNFRSRPFAASRAWRSGRSRTSLNGYERSLADRLLNQVVRPRQHRWRDRQPKRLRGLEVDHQLEFVGLLDGEIGRAGAL